MVNDDKAWCHSAKSSLQTDAITMLGSRLMTNFYTFSSSWVGRQVLPTPAVQPVILDLMVIILLASIGKYEQSNRHNG